MPFKAAQGCSLALPCWQSPMLPDSESLGLRWKELSTTQKFLMVRQSDLSSSKFTFQNLDLNAGEGRQL